MAVGIGVDFEHIYHTPAYRSLENAPKIPIDLQGITSRLLELFDTHDVCGTFFVVGEVAEEHPDLVRCISGAGHEIAGHTMTHPSLPELDTAGMASEIRGCRDVLAEVCDAPIMGFRAPTFQVNDDVYTEIAASYEYSSSTVPALPIPGFYSNEYNFERSTAVNTPAGTVVEQPVAVNPWLKLPISGAWTRQFGRQYTISSVRTLQKRGKDVLTYVHPWEFTSLWETPLPFRNRFRTGDWLFETYDRLLDLDVEWCTVGEIVERATQDSEYTVEN